MVVVEGETVDEEAVGVNVTFICTKGMVASRDTTKTHGMAHMVEAGIMGEGDTTNPQATIPQLKLTTAHMEGTAIIRILNKADTEVHLNRRMNLGLRINNPPTDVFEEDIILDMMARMVGRMGTLEGGEVLLPIEGEVRRMVTVGMGTEAVREGGIGLVVSVVDTTIPRRTGAAILEEVATIPVEAINLV